MVSCSVAPSRHGTAWYLGTLVRFVAMLSMVCLESVMHVALFVAKPVSRNLNPDT